MYNKDELSLRYAYEVSVMQDLYPMLILFAGWMVVDLLVF